MIWTVFFVFGCTMCLASSVPGYAHSPGGSSVWGYFTPPLIHRVPSQSRQTAMETMVDLTNNLGVAILQDHSYSRGNFAFSPYGVASVLVVLYEGARGESARQIHTAVGFPPDKDIIRVGFRDIHRHLRSYFSHEGYLSGISLNKDSSSLKPEYKKVLRFYGYDIEASQSPEENDNLEGAAFETTRTTVWSAATKSPATKDFTSATITPLPTKEKEETNRTVQPGITEEGPQNSTRPEDASKKTTAVTPSSGTTKPMFEPTESTTALSTTTDFVGEKVTTVSADTEMNLTTQENSTPGEDTVRITEKQKGGTTHDEEGTTNSLTSEKPTEETWTNTVTSTSKSWRTSETETQKTGTEEIKGLDNGMLIPQLGDRDTTPTEASTTTEQTSFTTDMTTTLAEESTKLGRNRKSLLTSDDVQMKNEIKTQSEKDLSKRIRNIVNTKVPLWLGGNTRKPNSRIKRTLTDYLKSPHSPDLSLQLQNGMYDTHVSRNADLYRSLPRLLFLVDGAVDTPVPMMTYTNVFPFAYIPRLHAKALEFPLDDIRYKLLILLPVERRGLRQLIYDLGHFPLNNVLTAVRPTRVRAMVPTFMVEGFVILTSSLQKLGIWDVFDPRKANLSAMSLDPELYVRNVEQSVTVVIRNYVEILDIQTRTMAARQMEHEFEATHPFLYFVLDTATNTALMAGQILDPLNSRIY